jgi:hypothetical protein
MKNTPKLKLIADQLEDLRRLIHKLKEPQEQIHYIDLDLALEKMRRIYDNLYQLKLIDSIVIPEKRVEEIILHGAVTEDPVAVVQPEVVIEKEPEAEPEAIHEPVVETKSPPKETKEKEPSPSLIDLFSETSTREKNKGKKTIVEKIAEDKSVEILAEKIGKKKILGLNQAIGINEKFFFINELFEGNMKEYKNAIDALDQFDSRDKSYEHLNALIEKFGWDKSKDAYTMLLDFVERKFN